MLVEVLVETSKSSNKKNIKKTVENYQLVSWSCQVAKKTRSGEMRCSMKVVCLDLLDGRLSHEGVIL